jgi:hypothetical protein
MDAVTITDHDSIDAAESLRRYPNFFLSEEVTCRTPSGTEFHAGVYGIEERHHIELQRRRNDLPSFVAFLCEQDLFFGVNHVFSGLTGPRTDSDFEQFEDWFPAVETLNGQMDPWCNRAAAAFAIRARKVALGGSDSHTLGSLGRTCTEVHAARDTKEFLEGLRKGRGCVRGEHGSYGKLTRAVCRIGWQFMRDQPLAFGLLPLIAAVPAVCALNILCERAFAARWARRWEALASALPRAAAAEVHL